MELNLDLLPDPVIVVDADLRAVAANSSATGLLGPLDDAGSPLGDALDARTGTGTPALRDGVPAEGTQTELTVRDADGADVDVIVTARTGADGTTVLALRPVGDRSGIGVISTVSHELRTPLTSVKGYVSLMLNRWDRISDDKKQEMLGQVHHDADRVTRLIGELLDISRLETGRLTLRRENVDLAALAAAVVDAVTMSNPKVECEIDVAGLPPVYADPDKITQVLTNLVENAAKYGSPVGMRITGSTEDGPDGPLVRIAVADTGAGIPAEDLPRIFTKFFRRDQGRPTGTGLGLWISRGLVEAHGGELTAISVEGEGSTFSFTLPADAFEKLHG